MKLITNKRAWRKFILEVAGVYKSNVNEQPEPKEYPCYAYAVVQSFNYEEEQPLYLYACDIDLMEYRLVQARMKGSSP